MLSTMISVIEKLQIDNGGLILSLDTGTAGKVGKMKTPPNLGRRFKTGRVVKRDAERFGYFYLCFQYPP